MNENTKELVLVYVKDAGKNTDGTYIYDLFFSETPEYVWGPSWDENYPVNNGDLTPDETTYSIIKRVRTTLPFKTAEETSCYSMEYATYGILALSWVNIDLLDEYPKSRCVLHFGDKISQVEENLSLYSWELK
jgi:hypothetical protein